MKSVPTYSFAVKRDEVSKSLIPAVPEVTDTTGLVAGHAETVDVSGEVSAGMLASIGCI